MADVGRIDSKIGGFSDILTKQNISQTSSIDAEDFESKLKKAYDKNDMDALKDVCADFESIFLNMMYKQMKATIPESEFLKKSSAEKIFEDMLDEEIINTSSNRGVGLAEMMYKQLNKQLSNRYIKAENEESKGSENSEISIKVEEGTTAIEKKTAEGEGNQVIINKEGQ